MVKIIWFFFCMAGAFCWFGMAAGFWVAPPLLVTCALVMLGFDCIIAGMKALVKLD